VNLPNAITVGRIAIAPVVAALAFVPSWTWRLIAFVLFTIAAVTDYWDGHMARTRGLVTDLGKMLDPLADKLLLVCTLVAMYVLQAPPTERLAAAAGLGDAAQFPFVMGVGASPVTVSLPLVVVVVVLGRELFMTIFRQIAARRGVVVAAIGPAKWKTALQSVWVGSAFFWFWAATLVRVHAWGDDPLWRAFATFNGIVGTVTMVGAVVLTFWSLGLYVRRYGAIVFAAPRPSAR